MDNAAKQTNVVGIKKKKNYRVEAVNESHIAEVWRLFEAYLLELKPSYPDFSEQTEPDKQSCLFDKIKHEPFAGYIAKSGRKPIGVLMASLVKRPCGRPNLYANVFVAWIDPQSRQSDVGKALWEEFSDRIKKDGIFHWELSTDIPESYFKPFVSEPKQVYSVYGGKF